MVRINGKLLPKRSLADHDVRLMMENFAVMTARVNEMKLLNHDGGNVFMKNLDRLERKHPANAEISLIKAKFTAFMQTP